MGPGGGRGGIFFPIIGGGGAFVAIGAAGRLDTGAGAESPNSIY